MQVFSSHRYPLELPAGHRFPVAKSHLLYERVVAQGCGMRLCESPAASDDELRLAHDAAYVDAVVRGTVSPAAQREIGFPWSERLVERSRRSVGATIAAGRAALAEGVAAQLAGGSHHASADKGSGWCVFNDVAVAARVLQAEAVRAVHGRPIVVWLIDLDVHQGNGSASIFAGDPSVFTLSVHAANNFPLRKIAGDLDVELPDGCRDREYLDALDAALDRAWTRLAALGGPGLAVYLAGADVHEGDRLGRLKVSSAGLAERDRRVFAFLHARRVPVAVTMAGGYGHDIETTVAVHLRTLQLALQSWRSWHAPIAAS